MPNSDALILPTRDPLTAPHLRAVLEAHGLVVTPPTEQAPHATRLAHVTRLSSVSPEQAIPALAAALVYDSNQEVRQRAFFALTNTNHPQADIALALALLDRRTPHLAEHAQQVLPLRRPIVVDALIALFQDRQIGAETFAPLVAQLAENHPCHEVRAALPHLKHPPLVLFPAAETRAALHEAIARIEAATGALRDLPLVADTTPKRDDLPLPAQELPDA